MRPWAIGLIVAASVAMGLCAVAVQPGCDGQTWDRLISGRSDANAIAAAADALAARRRELAVAQTVRDAAVETAGRLREQATTMPAGTERDGLVRLATEAERQIPAYTVYVDQVAQVVAAMEAGLRHSADLPAAITTTGQIVGAAIPGWIGAAIAAVAGLAGTSLAAVRAARNRAAAESIAASLQPVLDAHPELLGQIQGQTPTAKAIVDSTQKAAT